MQAQLPLIPTQERTAQTQRPYQVERITVIRSHWAMTPPQMPLIHMATGTGKTTVLAGLLTEVCNPEYSRALVLGHTQEIIYQLHDRIAAQYNGLLSNHFGLDFNPGIGVVMGDQDDSSARILIATRQSVHPKRLAEILEHGAFDYLIIDEGHHVEADNSYAVIINTLKAANPALKYVGFTATPKRTDKKALGAIYDVMPIPYGIREAVKDGYLVVPTGIKVSTDVGLQNIEKTNGDYDQKKLISVLDASNWVRLAKEAYLKYAGERQTIAFFPQVLMSRHFVAELLSQGIRAAHIDANTPKSDRSSILRDFQAGRLNLISNMAVLTEGFDSPVTSAILWARPTLSEVVFTQAIGRGLRLFPQKKDCLIISLTPVDTRALTVGTLLGKMITCEVCKAEVYKGFSVCPQCGADLAAQEAREKKQILLSGGGVPEKEHKVTGNGLHSEVMSLFADLSSFWYKDPNREIYTCSIGFKAGAMVIMPPSYSDNGSRLQERLAMGNRLLMDLPQEKRVILLSQLARLEREFKQIEHYTLWLTSEPDPNDGSVFVKYLRANTDLASLMMEADQEVLARTPDRAQVKRAQSWRDHPVSAGQISIMRALRIKGYGDKTLTKGQAAAMITNAQVIPFVMEFIDRDQLPERNNKS